MPASLAGLRARPGFWSDFAKRSEADQEQAIDVIAFVGDALAEGAVEALADWVARGACGHIRFPARGGGYLTASVERGGDATVFYERAGDRSTLAAQRR